MPKHIHREISGQKDGTHSFRLERGKDDDMK